MSVTAMFALAKAKSIAQTGWSFVLKAIEVVVKYWRQILVLSAVIVILTFTWSSGYQRGQIETDEKWITAYNETVKDLNERLKSLTAASEKVADKVDEASRKLDKDLNGIEDDLRDEADKEKSVNPTPNCKPTLYTPLPKSFLESWTEMNAAGAKHNPYTPKK